MQCLPVQREKVSNSWPFLFNLEMEKGGEFLVSACKNTTSLFNCKMSFTSIFPAIFSDISPIFPATNTSGVRLSLGFDEGGG